DFQNRGIGEVVWLFTVKQFPEDVYVHLSRDPKVDGVTITGNVREQSEAERGATLAVDLHGYPPTKRDHLIPVDQICLVQPVGVGEQPIKLRQRHACRGVPVY